MSSPMGRTLRAGEIPLTVVQCVHAAECAGCPLIHLDYAQQLTSKRARVVTAMSHYPSLELLYTRPVAPAEPMVGYRGRAKLIVSPEGRIGLYARSGNHEVVDIPSCRVLTPALADVASALREMCANPPEGARSLLLPYNPFGGGVLRALDLREVRLPAPFAAPAPPPQSTREPVPISEAGQALASGATTKAPSSAPSPSGHRDSQIPRAPGHDGGHPQPPASGRPDVVKRAARDATRRTEGRRSSEPAIDVLRWARGSTGADDLEPRSDSSIPPVSVGDPQRVPQPPPDSTRLGGPLPGRTVPHTPSDAPTSSQREAERIGVLVTFVLQRDRAPTREELKEAARALRPLLPRVVGIAVNFHDADAPQILGPDTLPLDGVTRAQDRIGGVYHLATFGSFVQAHREQAARVHTMITREIGQLDLQGPDEVAPPERPRVLDLYGGSGAISLTLARAGCQVTMVESFTPATNNARTAADAQNIRLDVRNGDVAEAAAAMADAGETFDSVVMNPPRRGVSPAAREAIALLGAPLAIYVSCDPDTLARDLDHFSRLGYNASEIAPFDMIPLTEEVETVCILRRSPPAAPRVIYEDDEILVVDKGPHEPIVQDEGEYGSSLLGRCARLPTVTDNKLEPIHRLDAGTSGLCMLARNDTARAIWSNALATTGRLIYLAAAKGVTPAKGAITRDLREGGRVYPARTRYRRLAIASGHSILRVIPDGGRTHQIRRHLAAIGHPVIGDERYGHLPTNRYFEEKHGLDRSFLHLVRIEIAHPHTGARLLIESTLPGDLRSALERATGNSVLRFLEQKHALGDPRASSLPPSLDDAPGSSRGSSLLPDAPASSRRSSFLPGDAPPSTRRPGEDVPDSIRGVDSMRMPLSERINVSVPDLDESPRTIRHAIVSDDED
jgi:23S rRNA (uracil1939-C5)-methyltransferase